MTINNSLEIRTTSSQDKINHYMLVCELQEFHICKTEKGSIKNKKYQVSFTPHINNKDSITALNVKARIKIKLFYINISVEGQSIFNPDSREKYRWIKFNCT